MESIRGRKAGYSSRICFGLLRLGAESEEKLNQIVCYRVGDGTGCRVDFKERRQSEAL